jgi:hypothetical protein
MDKQMYPHKHGGRGIWIARRVAKGIVIGLVFALVFGIFVLLLWNWLMPGVFGMREITYGQALGMIILARILFGVRGLRPGFAGRWRGRRPWAWGGPCSKEDDANSHVDWRHYEAWWEAEGREAFKKYSDTHGK